MGNTVPDKVPFGYSGGNSALDVDAYNMILKKHNKVNLMIDEKSFLLCLMKKFPEFKKYWAKDDNYNSMPDGGGSYSGICAEFSQFFIENFGGIDDLKLRVLFKDIETILKTVNSDNSKKELATSISSCFIENISRTKPGELSKDLMGELTRSIFDQWHTYLR